MLFSPSSSSSSKNYSSHHYNFLRRGGVPFFRSFYIAVLVFLLLLILSLYPTLSFSMLTTTTITAISKRLFNNIHHRRNHNNNNKIPLFFENMSRMKSETTSTSTNNRHYSTFKSDDDNNNNEDNNDLEKWQKMYEDNANPSFPSKFFYSNKDYYENDTNNMKSISSSEIRVVTFDLDNTIWKTSNVINSANDVLANYLYDNGIHAPIRVEKIMGELFKSDKAKYSPLLVEEALREYDEYSYSKAANDIIESSNNDNVDMILEKVKTPVLLTQLRIDALKVVFKNQTQDVLREQFKLQSNHINNSNNDVDDELIETLAKSAFDIWTTARHDAIPNNLASSVLECLDQVRSLKTSYGKNIVVGAITDGNSDPRKVDILKDYFAFCVNAESVGISKPDRRVYDAALLHVYSNEELRHVFHTRDVSSNQIDFGIDVDDVDCDALFSIMQDKWIHIGDDFLKDIVGAKELKMRSVWCTELVKDKLQLNNSSTTMNDQSDKTKQNESNVKESQLKKALEEKKVINMIIGSEDFLLDSIQAEFADEIVHEFIDVAKVLTDWHLEGLSSLENQDNDLNSIVKDEISQEVKELFTIVVPDDIDNTATSDFRNEEAASESKSSDTKFCVMCGAKLPNIAKFCSSCGNKQP